MISQLLLFLKSGLEKKLEIDSIMVSFWFIFAMEIMCIYTMKWIETQKVIKKKNFLLRGLSSSGLILSLRDFLSLNTEHSFLNPFLNFSIGFMNSTSDLKVIFILLSWSKRIGRRSIPDLSLENFLLMTPSVTPNSANKKM